jgi:hypothetical protein
MEIAKRRPSINRSHDPVAMETSRSRSASTRVDESAFHVEPRSAGTARV